MKKVTIKKMDLHYFKGALNQTVTFGENETIIAGPNGSGKTTIMDAFYWCMWGKNSIGQSDQKFLIKTVDENGEEIPHVDHEVQVTIDIKDESGLVFEETFKRVLTPKYDKEGNLNGNTTAYYWNDVPLKKSEYDAKVSEVISEDVFKLITSPYTFLQMPWEKQREMLMNMAGKISDTEVAGDNEDLKQLLLDLTGKTLDEYKREVAAKLKKVNEAMSTIPARIDEVQRSVPEAPDMEELQEEERLIKSQLETVEDALRSKTAQYNMVNNQKAKLSKQISDLLLKQQTILQEKQSEERNEIHKSNAAYNAAEQVIKAIKTEEYSDQQNTDRQLRSLDVNMSGSTREITKDAAKLDDLRAEWIKVNEQTFQAEEYLKCPLYGHVCGDGHACSQYDQNQGAAFEKFTNDKNAQLEEITKRGQMLKKSQELCKQALNKDMAQYKTIQNEYAARKADRDAKIHGQQVVMELNPKRALISTIKMEDIQECMEIEAQLTELKSQQAMIQEQHPMRDTEIETRKASLMEQLKAIQLKAGTKDIIEKAQKRVQELEEELTNYGAQKAELEYKRDTIVSFEIAKTELLGSRINNRFKIVKWQMFMRQVNGEEIPACICMVNGVRYNDVNDAGKLDAGIDVASALSEAYQVSAPMFIDGAEKSLDIYNPKTAQRIILKVEDRNELSINSI